jgi:outer membrane lipoprotein SlyB
MWRSIEAFPTPPVHYDQTEVFPVQRQVPDRVVLVYENSQGQLIRVPVDQTQYSAWTLEQSRMLEKVRQQLRQQVTDEFAQGMVTLFQEVQSRVTDLADWHFAWATSYQLLWEAMTSTLTHLGSEDVKALVARDLERLLQRQYEYRVLQPALLDYRIQALYQRVLDQAHQGYLLHLAGLDTRFQAFVAQQTTYLDSEGYRLPVIRLDWVAQIHRLRIAPDAHSTLGAVRGISLVIATTLIGKTTGTALAARMATPWVSKAMLTVSGGVAGGGVGSLATPLGSAVGWVTGAVVGLAVDATIQKSIEILSREDFERSIQEAVDSTQKQWQEVLVKSLTHSVDSLFDDTRQLLLQF